ncbi:MAG: TauD/TfdA family dioxygenase [Gammaproteobacteria bacterium]|nr:TauD/TfdA family dioxygenase [Gammaproteobacteria bacterium]
MSSDKNKEDLFKPRDMNTPRDHSSRTDGWVGGRADTWFGHYRENPASRSGSDARRMATDQDYARNVANNLRQEDDALIHSDLALSAAGLTVEPLSPGIGIEVRGLDMASPTDAQIEQIWRLYLSRKVVFFRDQGHISWDEHIAFGKLFADIGFAFGRQRALGKNNSPEKYPEILRLYSDEAKPFAAANWHSDVTWSNRPPLGSILLARKAPPVGGDTVFVDCYALWDSLNPALQEFLQGRMAVHGRGGRDEAAHPICRTHPETGRNALYINPTFTNSIHDMEAEESARLLAKLYAKMYSTPEHTCRFRWRDGSVAMWDNRSCQHYAVADFWPHERKMERVTLVDRSEEDEVPFWKDENGERHFSVRLATQESIDTPLGYA